MANIKKNFISLVVIGGPNPQILNVDFLKDNRILPENEPPFDKLLKQEQQFTKFVSVEAFSNLVMENIEFFVDNQRFQIRDSAIANWTDTKILSIAKRYFEVLPYTPLKVVGINLNSTIEFDNNEENAFEKLLLPLKAQIRTIVPPEATVTNATLAFPYTDTKGHIKLSISKPDEESRQTVNFNYEFEYEDKSQFEKQLEKLKEIAEYFDSILNNLMDRIK